MKNKWKSIKEMIDGFEKEKKAHPIKDFFFTIWCKLELYLWDKPRYFLDNIKYFIQRGKRGYSDMDLWDLDWYLAEMIPNALRDLRNTQHCLPGWIEDEDYDIAKKRWDEIIDDIIYALENTGGLTYKLTKEEKERYNRGWRLFKKHFSDLSD